jgi:hypothetical protein
MRSGLTRLTLPALAGVAVLGLGAGVTARAQNPGEKQVIVTVIDTKTNKPVPGLPASAFAIREDNLDREIVRVEHATAPVAVVLLADTTTAFTPYVRDMRVSSQAFFKAFFASNPGSAAALWEFGGAGMPIVGFTSEPMTLDEGAGRLFPKGTLSDMTADLASAGAATVRGQNITASNLLEAIADAGKALQNRKEPRRVLVSFNDDLSVEASRLPGKKVQDEVQRADATWFAVSLQEHVANGPLRDNVINVLCPYSGGARFTIVNIAALESALTNVADIIANQYVVTYRRPSGSASQVIVGIRQEGLKASTPRWAPK